MNKLDTHGSACRVQHQAPVAPHACAMQVKGTSVASLMTDRF